MTLASFRAHGSYNTASEIAWQSMFDWLERCGHHIERGRGYGFALHDPRGVPDAKLRYDACVELPASWKPSDQNLVRRVSFDGGPHGVINHVGAYANIGELISTIRDVELPKAGLYVDRERPLLTIFYDDPRHIAPDQQRADVCIPISTAQRSDDRPGQ